MTRSRSFVPLLLLLGGLAACSKSDSQGTPASAASRPPSKWALAAEPAGAISVVDAQKAAPKDDVVVVGRLREFVTGRAAFTLVDASVAYCGDPREKKMDEPCEHPWDYCCHEQEAVEKQIFVAASDAAGDAAVGPIPELRNLDLVVVRGKLTKSKAGDVELAATGWYRKERPPVPPSIVFPQ
jgi:hypothetical protein